MKKLIILLPFLLGCKEPVTPHTKVIDTIHSKSIKKEEPIDTASWISVHSRIPDSNLKEK